MSLNIVWRRIVLQYRGSLVGLITHGTTAVYSRTIHLLRLNDCTNELLWLTAGAVKNFVNR